MSQHLATCSFWLETQLKISAFVVCTVYNVRQHDFFAADGMDWSAATSHDCNERSWPAPPGLGGQTEAEQLAAVTDSAHGLRTEALAGQHSEGKVTEKEQRLFDGFSGYWEEEDADMESEEAACTIQ